MPKLKTSKKKTDQKTGYEVKRVKRLVLYVIGKSSVPLSAYDIQKNVVKQMPGYDKQRYSYTVLKQLVSHQREIPYELLFRLDDFFDSENSVRVIPNDDVKNMLIRRVIRNVFKSYWYLLEGNEEEWECSIPPIEENKVLVIRIKHKKEQGTALKFVFRQMKESNRLSSRLYYKRKKIPLREIREKGTTKIYSIVHFPYLHLKQYLDEVPKRSLKFTKFSNKPIHDIGMQHIASKVSSQKDIQFVLNLRGLLYYMLLNEGKSEITYRQTNEVIETLTQIDTYHDLDEEFKAMDSVRPGITVGNKIPIKTSNNKIKERFPFLSRYNEFKECLPINFAVDILREIAIDLQDKLEKMNIFDLKYEVTQKFFENIEASIWGVDGNIFPSEPIILSMNPNFKRIRSAYMNYQHEISTYIKTRKEKEIKILEKRERNARDEIEILDFKLKILEYLENETKDIISITEITESNISKETCRGLTGTQINILKNICEFERPDYQFGWHHLFKRTLIEDIQKAVSSEIEYATVKRILMEKGNYEEGVIEEVANLVKYNNLYHKDNTNLSKI
jgi:hypothetical protein